MDTEPSNFWATLTINKQLLLLRKTTTDSNDYILPTATAMQDHNSNTADDAADAAHSSYSPIGHSLSPDS